jgi:hypothetical protein
MVFNATFNNILVKIIVVVRKCLRMKNSYYSNILIYLSKFKWNNTNLKSNFWFEKEKKKFCLTTTIILTKILLKVALNTINQPKFLTLEWYYNKNSSFADIFFLHQYVSRILIPPLPLFFSTNILMMKLVFWPLR